MGSRLQMLLAVVALLLMLGLVVAGCRKSGGSDGGGDGYLPAPTSSVQQGAT
jgi:hypothetical protein